MTLHLKEITARQRKTAYLSAHTITVTQKPSRTQKRRRSIFFSLISGKSFEFPVAFDIEDNSQKNLSREEISNIVEAFCGRTEKAGYFVSVYANLWWLNNKISDRVKEHYDIWLAQWADAPSYGGKYGMWQYTSSGKTDGITGNTDMDLAFKDYPNIMRANGLNGFSKGAAESTDNVKSGAFPPRRSVALCNTPLFSSAYSKSSSRRENRVLTISTTGLR